MIYLILWTAPLQLAGSFSLLFVETLGGKIIIFQLFSLIPIN